MEDIEARDYAAGVVRRSGSSFAMAMRILPPDRRAAMYAVYAFCREVDDIVDEPGREADKRARLAEWRNEIARLYDGRPESPVGRALLEPVRVFGLRRENFLAVIEGMETDSAERLRMPDMAALETYCDRVACAVGRLSVRVFGIEDALGAPLAAALGQALQLTNILRDLAEDAALDRMYLPGDLLAAHGIGNSSAGDVLAHAAFPEACRALAALAARRFAEAEAALARCDRRRTRPATIMKAVYRRLFDKLCARGWQRLDRPVALGAAEKLWIVVRYGIV